MVTCNRCKTQYEWSDFLKLPMPRTGGEQIDSDTGKVEAVVRNCTAPFDRMLGGARIAATCDGTMYAEPRE